MNEFPGPGPAPPDREKPARAPREPDDVAAIPRRRRAPRRKATAVLVAVVAAWVIGREASERIERHDIEIASRRQPPVPGIPKATRTAVNNNMIMRLGLVGDLDGTAIAYTAEADLLVFDGQFRVDFSLEHLARILGVGSDSLADARSPHEINPDAVLFRAQVGTLTENGKAISMASRRRRTRERKTPDAIFGEWVTKDFAFTLNRLKHPNEEERIVLSAIGLAAAEIPPKPGARIRAVGVTRGELERAKLAISPGMLPLEAPLPRVVFCPIKTVDRACVDAFVGPFFGGTTTPVAASK
jgi:hypothetical protein